jgi:SsrA-binding protein
MSDKKVSIKNKRASFEYHLVDKYVAGIQLLGTEIKSLRDSKASIVEGHCAFEGDELFVLNITIHEYSHGTYNNHDPKRKRKLLLNRRELNKIKKELEQKGFTIVPLRLFINDSGLAKLEIAVAQGKKLYDKREDLKLKDTKRQMDRLGKVR